ncbi:hypothetical protein CPG38_06835 [Malaciobacter marinus]|uniref:terminase small subunit n=1 Tax=Malaciobacter marinus TaxID=505249 RepID=UPI000C088C27|nr:terminase small subunit [Malaciobacter marinus]PHO12557.1 hypothetical protein CPG38_06835 [Malaciobacter marinus]
MSDLTVKQISFCKNYILTRDIKQSSLSAGYSQSYSKSKAYELLQDEKIQNKIKELEKEHNQEHFKRLSTIANKELETILLSSDNDNTRLRAIELIYKLSGIIQDDKISLNVNNASINQNVKSLDDFYDKELTEDEAKRKALDLGVPLSVLI